MDSLFQLGELDLPWINDQGVMRARARELVASMRGSWPLNQQALSQLIKDLPSLSEDDLSSLDHLDGQCPICFVPFLAILAEEEMAQAMDSPAHPLEELGVTRLSQTCGHIFCRKDISKWISTNHDTCPSCRRPLVTPTDTRPPESIPDSEISASLVMIEQTILTHLEELRQFRTLAQQQQQTHQDREQQTTDGVHHVEHDGAGLFGGGSEDDEDAHYDLSTPLPLHAPDPSSRNPSSRTVDDEYFGMYS